MTDMLLGIGCIALFAYGYWVMARLDRYVDHTERRGFAHLLLRR